MRFSYAIAHASPRTPSEDRVCVFECGDALVVALADGAGGMGGAAEAAQAFVTSIEKSLPRDPYDLRAWVRVFVELDVHLFTSTMGQTTGVLVVVSEHALFGISAGDSRACIVGDIGIDELTRLQARKRLGSGRARPVHFHRQNLASTLIVASDGLFDHADRTAIAAACVGDARTIANRLVSLPMLMSGTLPDDVSVVVVRGA